MSGELMSALVSASASALVAWTKNFNIGHNSKSLRGRAFIFHMCIPYDKTFHMVP